MSEVVVGLERDYRDFDLEQLPCAFSQRILAPMVLLQRRDGECEALLGAFVRPIGRSAHFVACITTEHNWVEYKGSIRPLPHDVVLAFSELLDGASPGSLSFPEVLRILRASSEEFEVVADESIFETANACSEKAPSSLEIPGLRANLFRYQAQGISWMNTALAAWGGVILADEMGLGKTMQIISLLLLNPPSNNSPALIVCPSSLMANWCREITTFAPEMTLVMHRGSNRTGYYKELLRSQVVITTYDTLVVDLSMFMGVGWSFVICDEAQAVKNPESKRRKAIGSLDRGHTIPVTGTPMENTLLDLWSLGDLAIPGVLGDRSEFEITYPDDEDGAIELAKVVETFLLRRKVEDVAGDLPVRTDVDIPVELDTASRSRYECVREDVVEKYGRAGRLVAVGQLALFCAHPWLQSSSSSGVEWEDDAVLAEGSIDTLFTPKLDLCVQLLKEGLYNKRKILVFAAFNNCAEIIRTALGLRQSAPHYWNVINGSTPQEDRLDIVDEFSSYEGPGILILNPKAAGAGLNITAATLVIHYTMNWNPALEMQASARAHRRGQKSPVTIYRLFYADTVEETMIERSEWKRSLGELAVPISSREESDLDHALAGGSL